MAITRVAKAYGTGSNTDNFPFNLDDPSGSYSWQAGDLWVAIGCSAWPAGSGEYVVPADDGTQTWTVATQSSYDPPSSPEGADTYSLTVAWTIPSSDVESGSFQNPSFNGSSHGWVTALRGADSLDDAEILWEDTGYDLFTSYDVDAPSVTAAAAGSYLQTFHAALAGSFGSIDGSSASWTTPSGMTQVGQIGGARYTSQISEELDVSGASGIRTATVSWGSAKLAPATAGVSFVVSPSITNRWTVGSVRFPT